MSANWLKVRDLPELQELKEDKRPPDWLESREYKRGISFRVRYRKDGVRIEEVLKGADLDWKKAFKLGEQVVGKALYSQKPVAREKVRCEDLCRQLIEMRKDFAPSTYEGAQIHFEKHIIPYLNEHCPFANKLTPAVYQNYRAQKRILSPDIAIYNHWKHFGMLFKYAFEQGILDQKHTLKMEDRKKRSYSDEDDTDWENDDGSAPGKVIPRAHLDAFLKQTSQIWKDRATIQSLTGMRPGEVRKLRKNRVNFQTGEIKLRTRDTKTGEARAFIVPPQVLVILKRLKLASNSPCFFPNQEDPNRPMGSSLKGWHQAWERAGVTEHYTPHDLRHTFLTEMFKTAVNPALICYSAGLSLAEADKTYLHFNASDTLTVASEAAKVFLI